jgi:Domain of unknown function (DUF4349)/Putative zinc-finger
MKAVVHPVVHEEIMALLDGELAAERAQSVSEHLEGCSDCRQVAANLSGTSQSLAGWAVRTPADPDFEQRVIERARASEGQSVAVSSSLRALHGVKIPLLWGVAGTAVLALILVGLVPGTRVAPSVQLFSGDHPVDLARANNRNGNFDRYSFGAAGKQSGDGAALQQEREGGDHGWVQHGPMIARTVSLSIIAKDFSASRAVLDAILLRHHGYAANLSVNAEPNAARSLHASLRVPAPELGAVLAELKSLGRVQNETQSGDEVTQQHTDLLARLKNSRAEEGRLEDILLKRTGKISDVLAVEQEIASVRGEIERMEAEQKSLEHRVEFATVEINLLEEYKAQLERPAPAVSTRFHNALVKGIRGAQETIIGIVLFCAEFGPSLVLWVLILVPAGWFFWRRWRRAYAAASSVAM